MVLITAACSPVLQQVGLHDTRTRSAGACLHWCTLFFHIYLLVAFWIKKPTMKRPLFCKNKNRQLCEIDDFIVRSSSLQTACVVLPIARTKDCVSPHAGYTVSTYGRQDPKLQNSRSGYAYIWESKSLFPWSHLAFIKWLQVVVSIVLLLILLSKSRN